MVRSPTALPSTIRCHSVGQPFEATQKGAGKPRLNGVKIGRRRKKQKRNVLKQRTNSDMSVIGRRKVQSQSESGSRDTCARGLDEAICAALQPCSPVSVWMHPPATLIEVQMGQLHHPPPRLTLQHRRHSRSRNRWSWDSLEVSTASKSDYVTTASSGCGRGWALVQEMGRGAGALSIRQERLATICTRPNLRLQGLFSSAMKLGFRPNNARWGYPGRMLFLLIGIRLAIAPGGDLVQ